MKKLLHLGAATVLVGLLLTGARERVEARPASGTLTIGAMRSLFRDAPEGLVATLSRPLRGIVEAQAGMPGDMKIVGDAKTAAEQLENRELQIAVMHSFEYGWARQANPNLRILVVASILARETRFAIVVRREAGVQTTLADLAGTRIAIPMMTKEPGHLFLQTKCCGGTNPAKVFKEITAPGDGEDALNDVVSRTVQVALVEKSALDTYLKARPRQAKNLRVLALSENFPPGVLVYREGHMPAAQLARFRDGLLAAGSNPRTKALLKIIKLAGFDLPTADYEAQVAELLKVYPAR